MLLVFLGVVIGLDRRAHHYQGIHVIAISIPQKEDPPTNCVVSGSKKKKT